MKMPQIHGVISLCAAAGLILGSMLPMKVHGQLLGPPQILVQPLDQTVTNMGSVTFGVKIDASISLTLSYQWQLNGYNLRTPGSSGTQLLTLGNEWITYTQPNNTFTNQGKYSVKLTSTLGATVVSSNAVLKVVDSPVAVSGARMSTNGFQLHVTGVTGVNFVVYASSNLTTWNPVYTNSTLSGTVDYTDTSAAQCNAKYYTVLTQSVP